MTEKVFCSYCGSEIDLGRVLAYEVESLNFSDDEEQLEAMREDPRFFGEPLPTCSKCAESVKLNQREQEEDEQVVAAQQTTVYIGAILALLAALLSSLFWLF